MRQEAITRKQAMERLYMEGKTYKEIGDIFGISRQRVEQIINKEKYKLKRKENKKMSMSVVVARKKIIYPLLKIAGKEQIQRVLQDLVNYNQELRPIENYLNNITKETNIQECSRNRYRELVRKRDGYRCQLCGYKWIRGERKLDVHHINGTREDTKKCDKDFDKMITLCHQCHLRVDGWKINKNGRGKGDLTKKDKGE